MITKYQVYDADGSEVGNELESKELAVVLATVRGGYVKAIEYRLEYWGSEVTHNYTGQETEDLL